MLKKRDLIIIVCVLAVACVLFLLPREPGAEAVISVDGKERRYPLTDRVLELETQNGRVAVVLTSKSAAVAHSTCPDKICVKQGEITMAGQSIVCLPNRVTVTLEGPKGLDGVSG